MKTIKITCQGAATAALEDLIPLQGGLKKLAPEKYRKLKRALLQHGFSFPFFVWKRPAGDNPKSKIQNQKVELCILDGHQRDRALRRLKAQGYEIPPLPIDFIEAKDETEAKKKILLLSSQYGEMTDDSLMEFLKESEIDLDDVMDTIDLPQVDIEKLSARLEEELNQENEQTELEHQFQVIVDCKDEGQQLKLIEKLEKQRYICRALIL